MLPLPSSLFLSFVLQCVCGDGEYIIYTALALKNKSFGQALEFAWAQDSGSYATRESTSRVKGLCFCEFRRSLPFLSS